MFADRHCADERCTEPDCADRYRADNHFQVEQRAHVAVLCH